MSPYSRITQVAVHLPDGRQGARAIEDRLREHSPGVRVPAGLLSRLYGLEERVAAADGELPSDLGSHAVGRVLAQAALEPDEVDLLLLAAVSADVQEPANALNLVTRHPGRLEHIELGILRVWRCAKIQRMAVRYPSPCVPVTVLVLPLHRAGSRRNCVSASMSGFVTSRTAGTRSSSAGAWTAPGTSVLRLLTARVN